MSWANIGGAVAGAVVSGVIANELAPSPNNSAGDAAARASAIQAQISLEQWENYKKNYMPLEQELIAEARKAGSAEEIAAAEGRAGADVTGAYDRSRRADESRMQAYGINPASPAYAANLRSTGLAEGASYAGARTQAAEREKQRGYSRRLDVVGIGRGIPAQSAASAAGAAGSAGIWQGSINSQYQQNQQNMQNIGYGIQPIIGAAQSYFSQPSSPSYSANPNSQSFSGQQINLGNSGGGYQPPAWGYQPGQTQYADGGEVGLEKHGMRHSKINRAVKKAMMTPHLRRRGYANGGGVGMQGLEPSQMNQTMMGPGTEMSDSIPATVDGQKPAALSTGEFVMSAEVPKLSGEEILQAINRAGLEKRDQRGANMNRNMAGLEEGEYRGQ